MWKRFLDECIHATSYTLRAVTYLRKIATDERNRGNVVCFESVPLGIRRGDKIKRTFSTFFQHLFHNLSHKTVPIYQLILDILTINRHSMDGESMFCIKKSLQPLHEVTNNFPAKHNFSNKKLSLRYWGKNKSSWK